MTEVEIQIQLYFSLCSQRKNLKFSMLNVIQLFHLKPFKLHSNFKPPVIASCNSESFCFIFCFKKHLSDLKPTMRLEIRLLQVIVLEEFEAILLSTLERTSTTTGECFI